MREANPVARSMSRLRRLWRAQRGVTFANQVVALAIIGMALVMFTSALATTSSGVIVVRNQVRAQSEARRQMERIKSLAFDESGAYGTMATEDGGQHVEIQVEQVAGQTGLQLITVRVIDSDADKLLFELEGYKGDYS